MLIVHNGNSLHAELLDPRLAHYRLRHFPGVYWGELIDPATGQPWARYDATALLSIEPGAKIGEISNVLNLPEGARALGSQLGRALELKEIRWETWDASVFQKRQSPPIRIIFNR